MQRLLEFGIVLEERNIIDEFIEKLEKLQGIGVDVSKIKQKDTVKKLIEKQKIEIDEKEIERLGLKLDDRIGQNKANIVKAYRGNGNYKPPTKEQVQRLLEFGIVLDKKERTGKEIAEASISSIKDMELADAEDKALQNLVEQTKEGGINIDEQS